jgi:hypothetical protein
MLKKIFVPLMLSVSCALLFAACGGSDTSSNSNTTNTTVSNKTATTSTPTTPTTTTTPAATTPASGDKVGVAECDDYIAKMEACLSKLPAAAKQQYDMAFAQTRKQWRDAATNPQTKAALAQGCKAATDAAKTSMKSFNCDF